MEYNLNLLFSHNTSLLLSLQLTEYSLIKISIQIAKELVKIDSRFSFSI